MFNYPIIFLGLYLAITNFSKDFNVAHFNQPYDLSKFNFKPIPKIKPTIDSSLLFPKNTTPKNISFNEITYQSKFEIKYLLVPNGKDVSLIPSSKLANSFEQIVNNEKQDGYFLMNAGMFHPNFEAVGLTISDGKIKQELDTLSSPQHGNFYLYPNGVFTIDKNYKPIIYTTQDFVKSKQNINELTLATQSGPMLVINSQIHPSFSAGSKNTNIRNGVGINKKGEIIFAISETEINFYDFASFFRDELNCPNALYLDGTISEIYYRDKEKISHTPRIGNGKFGPIFIVKLNK
jgi:uncharacterized protein YigE (DUF2233 family)